MLLAAAASMTFAVNAQAATLFAVSGTPVTNHDPNNPVNLGNVFTMTTSAFATSLGYYTPTNIVGGGQWVGLYSNATGALLADTFVAASQSQSDRYVFAAIGRVLLTAGQQYTVVTNTGANAWGYGNVTTTGANFVENRYSYGAAPTNPMNTAGASGPAYIGPNLQTAAVPEPATWAMMIAGFGMVGFGMRTRKRQAVRVTYA